MGLLPTHTCNIGLSLIKRTESWSIVRYEAKHLREILSRQSELAAKMIPTFIYHWPPAIVDVEVELAFVVQRP
jgi:hypothetical protein